MSPLRIPGTEPYLARRVSCMTEGGDLVLSFRYTKMKEGAPPKSKVVAYVVVADDGLTPERIDKALGLFFEVRQPKVRDASVALQGLLRNAGYKIRGVQSAVAA